MWGRLLVVWILGAVPEAGMESAEIRSDYLINRLRLQEGAIRTSCKQKTEECKKLSISGPGEMSSWNLGFWRPHRAASVLRTQGAVEVQ
jgi:hypothetical protein